MAPYIHKNSSAPSSRDSLGSRSSSASSHSRSSSTASDTFAISVSPTSSYVNLDVDEPCPTHCENVIFDLGVAFRKVSYSILNSPRSLVKSCQLPCYVCRLFVRSRIISLSMPMS